MNNVTEDCFHLGVKGLIFNQDRKILLLKRRIRKCWDVPGGRMRRGETELETLGRELNEEIGLESIGDVRPFMMALSDLRLSVQTEDVGLILSFYLLSLSASFHPILSEEHSSYEWCTIEEATQKLEHYPNSFLKNLSTL